MPRPDLSFAVSCVPLAAVAFAPSATGRKEQKRGRYEELVEAVEKARGEAEPRDVALIAKQAPIDWRVAAWRLERRAPHRSGQRMQRSVEEELEAALDRLTAGPEPVTTAAT